MKLTAVNNITTRQNNNSTNRQTLNNRTNNVNFKGMSDSLINIWNFIDGSRAIQFTVEDMLGTNFPRTYKGAKSGYKVTGKINMPALLQESIREFLTGPIMSVTPFVILGGATALAGKSVDIHRLNVQNLSHIAKGISKETKPEDFKQTYFRAVIEDMISNSTGKEATKEDVDVILDSVLKYDTIASGKTTKESKKQAKSALGEISEKFKEIVKDKKDSYIGTNFDRASVTVAQDGKIGKTSIQNYTKYMSAFANDYVDKNTKDGVLDLKDDVIEAFKKNRIGRRVMTVVSMIAITGVVMSFIPKLYTWASGDTNPDSIAYQEKNGKEGK